MGGRLSRSGRLSLLQRCRANLRRRRLGWWRLNGIPRSCDVHRFSLLSVVVDGVVDHGWTRNRRLRSLNHAAALLRDIENLRFFLALLRRHCRVEVPLRVDGGNDRGARARCGQRSRRLNLWRKLPGILARQRWLATCFSSIPRRRPRDRQRRGAPRVAIIIWRGGRLCVAQASCASLLRCSTPSRSLALGIRGLGRPRWMRKSPRRGEN